MANDIKLDVYLQGSCFEFCIDGKYVEFEKIIKTLKNISSLNGKKNCDLKNPLYTFIIKIKDDGSGAAGFTFELSLILVKSKTINTTSDDSIEVYLKKEESHFFVGTQEVNCGDIIALLFELTNNLIGTVERREFVESFSKNSTQSLKVN